MKRLTTNDPINNTENMRNLVFVKNKEVYLRGLDENNEDISLVNYCKAECNKECSAKYDDTWDATTFGELMDCDCIVSVFYYACVGFAEVRERLMKYEDAE